jgi:two-component system response regulator PilR (NtrC family)
VSEATTLERPAAAAETSRILVVDDERSMREMLEILLRREGYEVAVAENGTAAIALLQKRPFDMLISDVRMPDVSGVDVLRKAKELNPNIIGIMITAYGSKESIQEVLRLQAADYLDKPFNVEELKFRIRKELERNRLQQENVLLKRVLRNSHQFSNILGGSTAMASVFQLVETIAPTSSTVLITGESGTGKELIAKAIHFNSPRKDRPFVAVNCGALSETLLDSELFGHVRGAFTGADTNKKGLIEVAEKGTVFLDEIGEMKNGRAACRERG